MCTLVFLIKLFIQNEGINVVIIVFVIYDRDNMQQSSIGNALQLRSLRICGMDAKQLAAEKSFQQNSICGDHKRI